MIGMYRARRIGRRRYGMPRIKYYRAPRPINFNYLSRYGVLKRTRKFPVVGNKVSIGGFPSKFTAKLRYATEITLNGGAATGAHNLFRANGMYDPDVTGVGHQPIGFDQLMQVYDAWTVIGSKITVTYTPDDTANLKPAHVGIAVTEDTGYFASLSGTNHFLEDPQISKRTMLGGLNYRVNNRDDVITKSYSPRKELAVKFPLNMAELQGDDGADPLRQVYFDLIAMPVNANDMGALVFKVVIDYIAVFTHKTLLAQS